MDTQRIEERVSLRGKTAVVVGGGTPIGRAVAEGLADTGAAVLLVADSDWEEAKEMVNRIRAEGGKARALWADPHDAEDAERVAQSAVEYFGGLDILVNNYCNPSLASTVSRQAMNENLKAIDLYSRAAAKRMISARRGGHIINLAWMEEPQAYASPIPLPRNNIAFVSKRLALDLAPYKINVNALSPGSIQTPDAQMQAAGLTSEGTSVTENRGAVSRPALSVPPSTVGVEPEDVTTVVLFLLSEAAENITGQLVVLDGEYRPARG